MNGKKRGIRGWGEETMEEIVENKRIRGVGGSYGYYYVIDVVAGRDVARGVRMSNAQIDFEMSSDEIEHLTGMGVYIDWSVVRQGGS